VISLVRVFAWALKELSELVWLGTGLSVISIVVIASGSVTRAEAGVQDELALIELVGVAVLSSLLAAHRQARELGSCTLRHVMTFPLRPAEIVGAKALAFVSMLVAPMSLGLIASLIVSLVRNTPVAAPLTIGVAVVGSLMLGLVLWSLELAADAWPGPGLAAVLILVALYAAALVVFPGFRRIGNLFVLAIAQDDSSRWLGTTAVAALLLVSALSLTVIGLRSRNVE